MQRKEKTSSLSRPPDTPPVLGSSHLISKRSRWNVKYASNEYLNKQAMLVSWCKPGLSMFSPLIDDALSLSLFLFRLLSFFLDRQGSIFPTSDSIMLSIERLIVFCHERLKCLTASKRHITARDNDDLIARDDVHGYLLPHAWHSLILLLNDEEKVNVSYLTQILFDSSLVFV